MKWKMAVYIVKPDVNHFNTGTFVVDLFNVSNSELKSASKQATAIMLPHDITSFTLPENNRTYRVCPVFCSTKL